MIIVWFSYTRDAPLLLESVRSAQLVYPEAVLAVAEDVRSPLPSMCKRVLSAEGVDVFSTSFPRRGNLNGPKCIEGMLSEMDRLCLKYDDGLIVKTDSDVVHLRDSWLDSFMRFELSFVGVLNREGYTAGMGYGFSHEFLRVVLDDVRQFPPFKASPEDWEVHSRATRLAQGRYEVLTHPCGAAFDDYLFVEYNWGTSTTPEFYANTYNFNAVTVGGEDPPPAKKQADVMSRLIRAGRNSLDPEP